MLFVSYSFHLIDVCEPSIPNLFDEFVCFVETILAEMPGEMPKPKRSQRWTFNKQIYFSYIFLEDSKANWFRKDSFLWRALIILVINGLEFDIQRHFRIEKILRLSSLWNKHSQIKVSQRDIYLQASFPA